MTDQNRKENSLGAISFLYVTEIITLNIRCHEFFSCADINGRAWLIIALIQLSLNAIFAAIIAWDTGFTLSYTSGSVWLTIIIVNCIQSASNYQKIIQLFVNFFGYFSFLRYWQRIKEENISSQTTLQSYEIITLGILHLMFTVSVLACALSEIYRCDNLSALSIMETQLELFLLGYLAATTDWEAQFSTPKPLTAFNNEGHL